VSLELRYLRVLQGWGFARDRFTNTTTIITIIIIIIIIIHHHHHVLMAGGGVAGAALPPGAAGLGLRPRPIHHPRVGREGTGRPAYSGNECPYPLLMRGFCNVCGLTESLRVHR
jgi:hypothetical protein